MKYFTIILAILFVIGEGAPDIPALHDLALRRPDNGQDPHQLVTATPYVLFSEWSAPVISKDFDVQLYVLIPRDKYKKVDYVKVNTVPIDTSGTVMQVDARSKIHLSNVEIPSALFE